MLESLALFFIIVVGICYSFKTLCFMYDRFVSYREKAKYMKMVVALASIPTKTSKPNTKKKGT